MWASGEVSSKPLERDTRSNKPERQVNIQEPINVWVKVELPVRMPMQKGKKKKRGKLCPPLAHSSGTT